MFSCVLIIPAELRDKANTLAERMGWGPDNYSVPLSPSGVEPATHYGLHAWAQPSFAQMMQDAGDGVPPLGLIDDDFPKEHYTSVVNAVVFSMRDDAPGHFDNVAADRGLKLVA